MIPHPAWIEVDLRQFRQNLAAVRRRIGKRNFCLPVKANGYGHGLVQIARTAQEEGVDFLGVSCLQEGATLRHAGITMPILLFGGIHEEQIRPCVDLQLDLTISSQLKAELIAEACTQLGKRARVHLKIDTGMNRIGVRTSSAVALYEAVHKMPSLELVGIYSHLATADNPNHPFANQQIEAFLKLRQEIGAGPYLWHIANSGGLCFYPDSYRDLNMVRPGILAYGYRPDGQPSDEVQPCFTLKSKVSYFKVVAPGSGISYGHRYVTNKQSRVATLSIGYGDGYRRSLSSRSSALIRGRRYPVAGTICMDQLMVDLCNGEAYVGDEAVLIGQQGEEKISLWELVQLLDSAPHEVLTMLGERLPRKYLF